MKNKLWLYGAAALCGLTVGCGAEPTKEQTAKSGAVGKEQELLSGLKYIDLEIGSGEKATEDCMVTVHYTGWFKDGTKFESSRDSGKPLSFHMGENKVIRGWLDGVQGMKVGGKRKLIIPPELAYGKRGSRDGTIPPDAELTFEVELLKVLKG